MDILVPGVRCEGASISNCNNYYCYYYFYYLLNKQTMNEQTFA